MIRAQKLLEILKAVPPDTFVVIPAFDHSYRHTHHAGLVKSVITEGTSTRPQKFREFFGLDDKVENSNQIIEVVCIQ